MVLDLILPDTPFFKKKKICNSLYDSKMEFIYNVIFLCVILKSHYNALIGI